MKLPVIGIAGRARSGKDTLAKYIIEAIGGYRYAFADPIKAMTDAIGIPRGGDTQQDKEAVIPELGVSRRHLWQTLGTEWGRQLVNPNLWLIVAGWELQKRGPGAVISDVRFENEAAWIRAQGGIVIHIQRPDAPQVLGSQTHASEAGIASAPGDLLFVNTSSLEFMRSWAFYTFRPEGEVHVWRAA